HRGPRRLCAMLPVRPAGLRHQRPVYRRRCSAADPPPRRAAAAARAGRGRRLPGQTGSRSRGAVRLGRRAWAGVGPAPGALRLHSRNGRADGGHSRGGRAALAGAAVQP
ncbi:hypothetical protein IWQ56_007028, partial [Coemansia nantahalensis]